MAAITIRNSDDGLKRRLWVPARLRVRAADNGRQPPARGHGPRRAHRTKQRSCRLLVERCVTPTVRGAVPTGPPAEVGLARALQRRFHEGLAR